jgi:hypothetical protein
MKRKPSRCRSDHVGTRPERATRLRANKSAMAKLRIAAK